ncbi:MAG: response regulator [Pseudobdellovibrio sp.]
MVPHNFDNYILIKNIREGLKLFVICSAMFKNAHKRLLIVDDSRDNQILLEMLFKAYGYQVLCASDGQEALDILEHLKLLPHLILLDAQMPIMNGHDFRLEQKSDSRFKNIPVVVMTADDDLNEIYSDMVQPEDILLKPLQIKSVIQRVSATLERFEEQQLLH